MITNKMNWLLITLGLLLIIGLGCEPHGGGYGYQYLGRVEKIRYVQLDGVYTTEVTVYPDVFVVKGRITIPKLHQAYVWANVSAMCLRLRVPGHNITVEQEILSHTRIFPASQSPLRIVVEE